MSKKVLATAAVLLVIILAAWATYLTSGKFSSSAPAPITPQSPVWYVFCGTANTFSVSNTITLTLSPAQLTQTYSNGSSFVSQYISNEICHTNHWIAVDQKGIEVTYTRLLGFVFSAYTVEFFLGYLILVAVLVSIGAAMIIAIRQSKGKNARISGERA